MLFARMTHWYTHTTHTDAHILSLSLSLSDSNATRINFTADDLLSFEMVHVFYPKKKE